MEEKEFIKKLSELKNITDKEEYAKVLADFFVNDKLSLITLLLMAIDWGGQPQWISVDDELPKEQINGESAYVLVTDGEEIWGGYYMYKCAGKPFNDWISLVRKPTHWMPFPQPPKKGDEK